MSIQEKNTQESSGFQQFISSLSAGFVTGIITIIVSVSFAALIFTGDLAGDISNGVGLFLFGAFLAGIISALISSFYGAISIPQDVPSILLGAEVAAISSVMLASQSSADPFLTAAAVLIFTSLLTSLFLFIMGVFNLGAIVRYLPYPVIGGFMAGAGWLLFKGGLSIVDVHFNLFNPAPLFTESVVLRWGSAVLFGVLVLIVVKRTDHFLALPGMILGGVAVFFGVLWAAGVPVEQAAADGWFLGPFSAGSIFRFVPMEAVQFADWRTVFEYIPHLGAVAIVSVTALLLNINEIEFSANEEIDLQREMISVGFSNLALGLTGSSVAYPSLNLSVLNVRMGARSRLAGIFSALFVGSALFFGAPVLSLLPKPILGGLVVFLGLALMWEWLVAIYKKLSLGEYALIWIIMLVMTLLGTLEAVGIGLLLSIAMFVANHSRTAVIKHTFSASNYRSSVDRDSVYTRVLQNRGNWLRILELQGYIFFGTAHGLLEYVREMMAKDKKNEIRYIVLGFRNVAGLDVSSLMVFEKLIEITANYGAQLLFVSLSEETKQFLEKHLERPEDEADRKWHIFDTLDLGVEWCEDEIVRIYQSAGLAQRTRPANKKLTVSKERKERLAGLMGYLEDRSTVDEAREKTLVEKLEPYMEQRTVEAGEFIIQEGARIKGLFFIQGGTARVEITDANGNPVRLRKMQAGSVVGEMSLYGKRATSANVIADETCEVHFLSKAKVRELEKEDIALANEMHKFLTELMGYRTASTTDTIRALLD